MRIHKYQVVLDDGQAISTKVKHQVRGSKLTKVRRRMCGPSQYILNIKCADSNVYGWAQARAHDGVPLRWGLRPRLPHDVPGPPPRIMTRRMPRLSDGIATQYALHCLPSDCLPSPRLPLRRHNTTLFHLKHDHTTRTGKVSPDNTVTVSGGS
jgi:hypothetical protein